MRGSRQFQRGGGGGGGGGGGVGVELSFKQFEFTFYLHVSIFAGSGQFTKRLLIISADAKGKDSMILFKIKETAHINSGHVLF